MEIYRTTPNGKRIAIKAYDVLSKDGGWMLSNQITPILNSEYNECTTTRAVGWHLVRYANVLGIRYEKTKGDTRNARRYRVNNEDTS